MPTPDRHHRTVETLLDVEAALHAAFPAYTSAQHAAAASRIVQSMHDAPHPAPLVMLGNPPAEPEWARRLRESVALLPPGMENP